MRGSWTNDSKKRSSKERPLRAISSVGKVQKGKVEREKQHEEVYLKAKGMVGGTHSEKRRQHQQSGD